MSKKKVYFRFRKGRIRFYYRNVDDEEVAPSVSSVRVTASGDARITATGDNRITAGA